MVPAIIKKAKALLQRLIAIMIFLLIWEIAVRTGLTYPASIPPVSRVFIDLAGIALSGILWKHTAISLQRVFSGYAIAVAIAIPLGFLIGWFKTWDRYLDPLLQTLRQVPLLALFPVFILLFGIGELSKTLLIMLAAMWWILLSTISAVQDVDPFLVKTARSMGVSHLDMFRKVVLPSAFPLIFTGLRYASTEVILVLIAVEMLGANAGLGILLHRQMWPVILFMTILGVIANYFLMTLERKLCNKIYASVLIITIVLAGGIAFFSRGQDNAREIPTAATGLSEQQANLSEHKESAEAGVRITAVYDADASEIKLHLHTMSGSLDYDIKAISYIRDSNGNVIKPEAWEGGYGGQHLEGSLKFPEFDDSGGFELVIRNIADVKERVFKW